MHRAGAAACHSVTFAFLRTKNPPLHEGNRMVGWRAAAPQHCAPPPRTLGYRLSRFRLVAHDSFGALHLAAACPYYEGEEQEDREGGASRPFALHQNLSCHGHGSNRHAQDLQAPRTYPHRTSAHYLLQGEAGRLRLVPCPFLRPYLCP